MRRALAILSLAAVGCGGPPQIDGVDRMRSDAIADMTRELDACKQRYPKLERGKAADGLRCSTAVQQHYAWINGRGLNNDLVNLAAAKSVAAGEKFDAGKISASQLDIELASIVADLNTGTQQRLTQSSMAEAAARQADAATAQAAAAQTQASMARAREIQDAFTPQKPTMTNCSGFGNTVNCTSY